MVGDPEWEILVSNQDIEHLARWVGRESGRWSWAGVGRGEWMRSASGVGLGWG